MGTIKSRETKTIAPETRLGDLIRRLRVEKEITLRKMADTVEISAAHMSDIETSKRHPSPKNLESIAKVLGVEVEMLKSSDSRIDSEMKRWAEDHPVVGVLLRQLQHEANPEQKVQVWLNELLHHKERVQ